LAHFLPPSTCRPQSTRKHSGPVRQSPSATSATRSVGWHTARQASVHGSHSPSPIRQFLTMRNYFCTTSRGPVQPEHAIFTFPHRIDVPISPPCVSPPSRASQSLPVTPSRVSLHSLPSPHAPGPESAATSGQPACVASGTAWTQILASAPSYARRQAGLILNLAPVDRLPPPTSPAAFLSIRPSSSKNHNGLSVTP
jgi:hypothetical protein